MGKRWYHKLALRLTIVTLIASLISSSLLTALAQEAAQPAVPLAETATEKIEPVSENASPLEQKNEPEPPRQEKEVVSEYSQLMRTVDTLQNNEVEKAEKKDEVIEKIDTLIDVEKGRLERLGVSEEKQEKYFRILQKQKEQLQNPTPAVNEPPAPVEEPGFFERLFGDEEPVVPAANEVQIPQEPATFEFAKDDIQIQQLEDTHIQPQAFQYVPQLLASLVVVDEAHAFADNYMPTIDLVRGDDQEVIITPEMRNLVKSLNNNPVAILNYVKKNIAFEPYYGAKKGSLGCLKERVCNDVDTSSLTIALLRAAGVPARYQKSAAVFSVEQLKNLLGVEETKTVFAAFAVNKVPIFTLTDGLVGEDLDDADFSNETHLALEWTHVELFYDYDQNGGTPDNTLDASQFADTAALRDALRLSPKKHWIPVDAAIKTYSHTTRDILADRAGFDSEQFWFGYFQYQGNVSPLDKYKDDLRRATGVAVEDSLSTKAIVVEDEATLPSTLPYLVGSGEANSGNIEREYWGALPDSHRQKVRITLKRGNNNEVVFAKTFYGSKINNGKFYLEYEGATEVDSAVINEHGGIHATPAALVDIVPFLNSDEERFVGVDGNNRPVVQIGETLLLGFDYLVNNQVVYDDQKFSIAGNIEGIAITLSQAAPDDLPATPNEAYRNSALLAQGNAALAQYYLYRIQSEGHLLKQSLDYEFNINFARAIVTQNRILNEVEGTPTTFDFKGLTLDAATYIFDYSNRGNYKTHRKDFRLLWGLSSSWNEAKLFEDVAGISSIATVQGIQYAYAHPNEYQVHRITQANENLIDGLNLSQNTKANMHAAVREGNTILTPNKNIQKGNWRGVLYVSLDPVWTGTYAIGEQAAQNGAWTDADFEVLGYENENHVEVAFFRAAAADNTYKIFEDKLTSFPSSCRILRTTYDTLKSQAGDFWGEPCFSSEGSVQYGTVSHSFVNYTNATKFYAVNESNQNLYNYVTYEGEVKNLFDQQQPGRRFNRYKFNVIAGTFSAHGSGYTAYYQPGFGGRNNARVWLVSGDFLSKLEENGYKKYQAWCSQYDSQCSLLAAQKNYVLYTLGFPTSNEAHAATSYPFDTDGSYQNFIGGQIYKETEWINDTYYVPGFIEKEYNRNRCYEVGVPHGCGQGTAGPLGFPVSDPTYNSQVNMVFQDFENGTRIRDFQSRPVGQRVEVQANVSTIGFVRNYSDPRYQDDLIEGVMDSFTELKVYGVVMNFAAGVGIEHIISRYKWHIVNKLGKKAVVKTTLRYVPFVGWAYAGITTALAVNENWPIMQACRQDPDAVSLIEGKSPAYYCGRLAVDAAAFALGAASSHLSGSLINKFGVTTATARLGKNRLMSRIQNDDQWYTVTSNVKFNVKSRTNIFEDANAISDDMLNALLGNQRMLGKFTSSHNASGFFKRSRDISRYDHIFLGDAGGGWHYYQTRRSGAVIRNKVMGNNGIYRADAEFAVNGEVKLKPGNTFFPDEWTEGELLEALNSAFDKKIRVGPSNNPNNDLYRATVRGVVIDMYIENGTGKLVTSFPSMNNF